MSDEKSITQQLAELYSGLERAHGTYQIDNSEASTRNKVSGKAMTLPEPVALDLWQKHLEGKRSLGIVPIRDDGTCSWACIDIDDYAGDVPRDATAFINKHDLPFVVCRSKSGGAHVFVFFKEPMQSPYVRAKLDKYAAAMGYPGIEVFPKQNRIDAAKGDMGNWLNMPYFDAERCLDDAEGRYGFDENHEKLAPEAFVAFAKSRAISKADFTALIPPAPPPSPFADGPPCLAAMAKAGVSEGGRNNAMFQFAVYAKKKHEDDDEAFEAAIAEYNEKHFDPPISDRELKDTIFKSFSRRDYGGYKCDEQPMASFCDRVACLKRQFGIGSTGMPYDELMQKLDVDALPDNWAELCQESKLSPVQFDQVAQHVKEKLGRGIRIAAIRAEMRGTDGEDDEQALTHHDMATQYVEQQGDPRPVGCEYQLWLPKDNVWNGSALEDLHGPIADQFNDQDLCKRKADYRALAQHCYDLVKNVEFFEDAPVGAACPSGFWTLDQKGALDCQPLSYEHKKRFILPCDPCEKEPTVFLAFLHDCFSGHDEENQILRVQEMLGALVLGIGFKYEKAILLHGGGNCGKSTLIRGVIEQLVPSKFISAVAPKDWSHDYHTAALAGMLANVVGELGDQYLDESFKRVLGRDRIPGRHPAERVFDFICVAMHFFNSNGFPNTRDQSSAFWRRWECLGFYNPRAFGSEDRDMDKKLEAELPQILHWSMAGAARLVVQNEYTKSKVHDAILEKWRRSSDSVAEWLNEDSAVEVGDGASVGTGVAFARYRAYCEIVNRKPLGRNTFLDRVEMLGHPRKRVDDKLHLDRLYIAAVEGGWDGIGH